MLNKLKHKVQYSVVFALWKANMCVLCLFCFCQGFASQSSPLISGLKLLSYCCKRWSSKKVTLCAVWLADLAFALANSVPFRFDARFLRALLLLNVTLMLLPLEWPIGSVILFFWYGDMFDWLGPVEMVALQKEGHWRRKQLAKVKVPREYHLLHHKIMWKTCFAFFLSREDIWYAICKYTRTVLYNFLCSYWVSWLDMIVLLWYWWYFF